MATITFNNSTFEYVEQGSGIPVVFVHGSINDYRIWKDQMEPFAKQYRVIAYSRRYHYPNEWVGDGADYSVDLHAQDLASLIKTLDLGRVHLIGSSFGAYTSLVTAIKNPDLVKTLVLGEPPVLPLLVSNPDNPLKILSFFIRDFSTARSFMKFGLNHMKPSMKALKNNQLEEGVRLFASGVLGEDRYEKLSDEKKAGLMDNARELKVELLGVGFPPFPKAEAGRMTIPTLFVYGENSPRFLHSISDLLRNILPNSEKTVIPNASHLIHGDNPLVYNERVLEFLSRYN
ncbi:MAG: alpha/beta hydrolase [Bacteroidota bacterium]|nr:alpha/beta hydrolase [Bacteroidota bacterium]